MYESGKIIVASSNCRFEENSVVFSDESSGRDRSVIVLICHNIHFRLLYTCKDERKDKEGGGAADRIKLYKHVFEIQRTSVLLD
jgi:hypothetical protein